MAIFIELLKQLTKRTATEEYAPRDETTQTHIRGKPQINKEKCTRCGLCSRNCPTQAIIIGKPRTDEISQIFLNKCIFCGLCEEICPFDAIKLSNDYEVSTYNIEELAKKQ
jgi:hydrogenase-4 component H